MSSNRDAILFLITFAGFIILMLLAVLFIGWHGRRQLPPNGDQQEDDDE